MCNLHKMKYIFRLYLAFVSFLFLFSCVDSKEASTQPIVSYDPVSPAVIRSHMAFLADDLLEGREAGTRGEAISARYIASVFEALGLIPRGDNGTFFQTVPLLSYSIDLDKTVFRIKQNGQWRELANGGDVAIFGEPSLPDITAEGGLVFAGYGITAPDIDQDDYAGLDVEGKFVVVIGGVPPYLPATEAALFGSTQEKVRTAHEHGAIGLIRIHTPDEEKIISFDTIRPFLSQSLQTLRQNPNASDDNAVAIPSFRMTYEVSQTLFEAAGHRLDVLIEQSRTYPVAGFPINASAYLKQITQIDNSIKSANVAGLLKGQHPQLANEYIVVTAHYDHVGICRPDWAKDRICNGAIDNALGVAAMLDLARQLSGVAEKGLDRSILFLAVGAEEKGLLGSRYFVESPTVSLESIIANINMDGGLPYFHFSDVIAFGAEQSEMGERLATALAPLNIKVAPDPFPEQRIFTRSDQYSFVKAGIPALFLYNGFTAVDGNYVGRALWDETLARHYHTPSDDLSRPIDYQAAAQLGNVFLRTLETVANTAERPLWYTDSTVGNRFAPEAPKAKNRDDQ